ELCRLGPRHDGFVEGAGQAGLERKARLIGILQILADPRAIEFDLDALCGELGGRAHARGEQPRPRGGRAPGRQTFPPVAEPPERINSRLAAMRWIRPSRSTSTPTARRPSNRIRRTWVLVINSRLRRRRFGLR